MQPKAAFAALYFGLFTGNGEALGADCAFSIVNVPQTAESTYDPFEFAPLRIPQSLQIRNTGSKTCDAAVVFFQMGRAEAAGPQGQVLAYSIETQTGTNLLLPGPVSPLPPQTRAALTVGAIAPGNMRSLSYDVAVRPGQTAPAGSYAGIFAASVYPAAAVTAASAGVAAPVPVRIAVKPVLSVNIAGAGQTVTLDFGVLTSGARRNVTIQARTNQRFRLSASSTGDGTLKLDPPSPDGFAWRVPYTIRMDAGPDAALTASRSVALSGAATPLAGRNVPLEVKIGDASGQRAGRYRDVITVTIDAAP